MINTENYHIRRMTRAELDIAVEWAGKEGWNPGIYDADAFYATDPNGFFIGLLDDKPVSCISVVSYGEHFGFLGFYIVHPLYRGRGFGMKIWNKALEYLKTQNIGLDGVVAQQENYKKSGFKLAYKNIRFQGKSKRFGINKNVVDLAQISFNELLKYDSQLFPAPRPEFLKAWISLPESAALGVIKDGKLTGYSVVRKCSNGYKVGPLFADNNVIAEQLFKTVNNFLTPGTIFFLDAPEVNPVAVNLSKKYRMEPCFDTARMYTKEAPNLPVNKIFGVTTFELG